MFFRSGSLSDGNSTSGWIVRSAGRGSGEWLHFFFPYKVVVDSVSVRNGIGSGDTFKKINRVKEVRVFYSGGQREDFVLEDVERLQDIDTADYVTTSLGMLVTDVYSSGADMVGIAEVDIKYHRPSKAEGAAFDKAVAAKKNAEAFRRMSSKEKQVLKEKKEKLDRKQVVINELRDFFDRFYTCFVTINEEYPRMFTEENFLRESSMFENFRSMLISRGVLQKYHEAVVSTSGLRYSIRTLTPDEVELWVKGEYTVIYDLRSNQVKENALYHLKKEHGEWKVKNKVEF